MNVAGFSVVTETVGRYICDPLVIRGRWTLSFIDENYQNVKDTFTYIAYYTTAGKLNGEGIGDAGRFKPHFLRMVVVGKSVETTDHRKTETYLLQLAL